MSTKPSISIDSEMLDLDTVKAKIQAGEFMTIAADESILEQLPAGNWIGGTIPYFMSEQGGTVSRDSIFVNTINNSQPANPPRITIYDSNSISRIAKDAPTHGFTLVILPASSDVHLNYAQNAPEFPNMFFTPIVGWISGFHLEDDSTAKVGFGPGGNMLMDQQAVAMHVPLPEHQLANVNIINLFEEGEGPAISFPSTGFTVGTCTIDGKAGNLAQFIQEHGIDTRSPLVADYSGIKVNVSVKNVDTESGRVDLYAPVFEGLTYHFARPVADYMKAFSDEVKRNDTNNIAFSCNCILNFLYSELEGKKTGHITGPITFGEVAYQLLNQTLVYMTLTEA
ncbi:DUF6976 family protein [Reinekea blandensis]|uniref:Uncharacterized protein n=1 Tax=Reinekea blandensis MED297 TaxID=314283 RepID=A4B9U1_9GAMM|nr:hypothetical protein [Reinekea blandensis]EAR11392.1 hypothetical protein MED297_20932 [Reinekea sp. MED297] [Reinekea blandensis MED297]